MHIVLYIWNTKHSRSWKKYGLTKSDTGGQQGLRLWKGFDRKNRWVLWPRKDRTVDSKVSQKSLVIWRMCIENSCTQLLIKLRDIKNVFVIVCANCNI